MKLLFLSESRHPFLSIHLVLALMAMIGTAPAAIVVDAHYQFGEPGSMSGANLALDTSGNGHHFTDGSHLGAFQVQSSVPSGSGSTASLHDNSGPSMYGAIGGAISDNFAVDLWTKTGGPGQTADVFEGNGLTQGSLKFSLFNGAWEASFESNTVIGTQAAATADQWIRLTVIRYAGSTTFYVNGLQSGSETLVAPTNDALNYAGFHLGINSGGAPNFHGNYDELRIWTFDPNTDSLATVRTTLNVVSDPFSVWINEPNWPGLADRTAGGDPDNDGMTNLIEYVLNGNPGQSDPSILPDLEITATDFEFTYSRLLSSLEDTTQIFEYGSDLSGWAPVIIPAGPGDDIPVPPATVTITDAGATDTVKIKIPKSLNVGGKLFGRLQVSKP